jgi:hypothetical protein
MSNVRLRIVALALLPLTACSAPDTARASAPARPRPFTLATPFDDPHLATELGPLLDSAVARVEAWFGAPFAQRFTITVFPHRADFDAAFPPEWGLTQTECWMVASGVADRLMLLSPRAWTIEACEHDPADTAELERLLAHELAHVYHGQHNPSPDFVDTSGIDWFAEGLAVVVSGQLDSGQLASARAALASGAGPQSLARAWSGKYRYGVSGSLVAFVERELGRARVLEMLTATSGEELLALVGWSEDELLTRWRADVLAQP